MGADAGATDFAAVWFGGCIVTTTTVKRAINRLLSAMNLRLETLTLETLETARIARLQQSGYFARPSFPLLPGVAAFSPDVLGKAFATCQSDVVTLMRGGAEPGGFDCNNGFYRSPDAEILYLMVRTLAPRRIVEVGSGNSTRVIRQAIADGRMSVEHIAIDPAPRSDITEAVDRIFLTRLEDCGGEADRLMRTLGRNDILFIDSSHEVRVGNDVARLFCDILPSLAAGVVVHVHDVFLPFDYPETFATEYSGWGEQYLLQALLQGMRHEVLWPGYYVQKRRPECHDRLPFLNNGVAQSFWFRICD
jgi:predicted O-methyltransferase YrrM